MSMYIHSERSYQSVKPHAHKHCLTVKKIFVIARKLPIGIP